MPAFILSALKTTEWICQKSISEFEAIFILSEWDGIQDKKWKNQIYNTDGTALCMNRTGEAQIKILITA